MVGDLVARTGPVCGGIGASHRPSRAWLFSRLQDARASKAGHPLSRPRPAPFMQSPLGRRGRRRAARRARPRSRRRRRRRPAQDRRRARRPAGGGGRGGRRRGARPRASPLVRTLARPFSPPQSSQLAIRDCIGISVSRSACSIQSQCRGMRVSSCTVLSRGVQRACTTFYASASSCRGHSDSDMLLLLAEGSLCTVDASELLAPSLRYVAHPLEADVRLQTIEGEEARRSDLERRRALSSNEHFRDLDEALVKRPEELSLNERIHET